MMVNEEVVLNWKYEMERKCVWLRKKGEGEADLSKQLQQFEYNKKFDSSK